MYIVFKSQQVLEKICTTLKVVTLEENHHAEKRVIGAMIVKIAKGLPFHARIPKIIWREEKNKKIEIYSHFLGLALSLKRRVNERAKTTA